MTIYGTKEYIEPDLWPSEGMRKCEDCGGVGMTPAWRDGARIRNSPCRTCKGTGEVPKED